MKKNKKVNKIDGHKLNTKYKERDRRLKCDRRKSGFKVTDKSIKP